MTVAIKREKGDLIWIDAVIQFNRAFQATVTKHPIETGAFVTDHTIVENPVLNISGVITDVDFNLQRPNLSEAAKAEKGWKTKQFENNVPIPDNAVMVSSDDNVFKKYLPESVSQFFPEQPASVTVNTVTRPKTAEALELDLIEIRTNRELVDIVEFDGGNRIKKIWSKCVMTNLSIEENPDSGDALWPSMTFEQVTFAKSKSVEIPTKVNSTVKNKAASTSGKGTQSTPKGQCTLTNPESAPTYNSKLGSEAVRTQNANNAGPQGAELLLVNKP